MDENRLTRTRGSYPFNKTDGSGAFDPLTPCLLCPWLLCRVAWCGIHGRGRERPGGHLGGHHHTVRYVTYGGGLQEDQTPKALWNIHGSDV